jgi:hypothetical protein
VPVPPAALQPVALNVMLSLPVTEMLMLPVQEVAPLVSVRGPPMVVPPLFMAVTVTESIEASLIMLFAPRLFPPSGEQDTVTSTVFETGAVISPFRLHDPNRQSEAAMKIVQVSFFMSFFLFNLC